MTGEAAREAPPFLSLDFLYVPSKDPSKDFAYCTDTLGGVPLFRIKHDGVEVGAVRLSHEGPILLLASHLEGVQPIVIYRIASMPDTTRLLETRGWVAEEQFEIPHGPICTFVAEGGQRFAIYELTRPESNDRFTGRFEV